jgi:hypothetical protein
MLSGKFAEFIEREVLPHVQKRYGVTRCPTIRTRVPPWGAAPVRRRRSRWRGSIPSGTTG